MKKSAGTTTKPAKKSARAMKRKATKRKARKRKTIMRHSRES